MTREQRLEAALKKICINPTPENIKDAMELVNICTACDRDLDWEGECSLCRDGREERGMVYQNYLED